MKGTFYMRAILIFMLEYSIHLPPIQTVRLKMSVLSVLEYLMDFEQLEFRQIPFNESEV